MGCLLVRGMNAGEHDLQPFDPQAEQLICGPWRCHGTWFNLVKAGLVVLQGITIEYGRLLAEHLEAVARALHHKDPVLIINGDRDWPLERLLTFL